MCHTPEQCVFGNSPTLTKLNLAYGDYSAEKWLVPQIVEVSLVLGLKEDATVEQTRFTASAIAVLYPWLRTDELMLFFFRFKAGCYEQFYSRFDPQPLLRSMRMFMTDRNYTTASVTRHGLRRSWRKAGAMPYRRQSICFARSRALIKITRIQTIITFLIM